MQPPADRPVPPLLARRLQAILAHRSLPVLAAVVAVVLTLPALGGGWTLDDYYHRTVLLGTSRFRELLGPPWEPFRFFRGDPERTRREMDLGLCPWWTDPVLKAEFLQMLTVETHRLDYALWPDSPALMHAQSLLWYAGLVCATAVFYRRMFGPVWLAGFAAVLFAIDDAHATPAGWLANRNSLVATSLGVLSLIAHDGWRRQGRRGSAALSLLFLAGSLLAKEEGIATCAYLLAYALFLDRAGPRGGVRCLLPAALVVLAWRALRAHWGYGVVDMGLYVDPLTDPSRFAVALCQRAPVLLLGLWGLPPSDVSALLPPRGWVVLWLLAAVYFTALGLVAAPLLRRDRLARFWATGSVLAVVPVCATIPADRLLTFSSIGAAGLLAQLMAFVFGAGEHRPSGRGWRVVARACGAFLITVHLVIAPVALWLRVANPIGPRRIEARLYVPAELSPSSAAQTVVVVNAPSTLHAGYVPLRRELDGRPVPQHTRVLAPALPSVTVRRVDDRTLLIRPQAGFLSLAPDRLFRSERRPLKQGERIELTGMTVEVTELTPDGRPAEARFRFAVPLEDPSLCWVCWKDAAFQAFSVPAVGEQVILKATWPLHQGRPRPAPGG